MIYGGMQTPVCVPSVKLLEPSGLSNSIKTELATAAMAALTEEYGPDLDECASSPKPSDPDMKVTGFVLVDADDNTDISNLADGDAIVLSSLPTRKLNIRAETSDADDIGSVKLVLESGTATSTQVENFEPYALYGDYGGNYRAKTFEVDDYTLTAMPYSERDGEGSRGTGQTIAFSVTLESPMTPQPTPAAGGIDRFV